MTYKRQLCQQRGTGRLANPARPVHLLALARKYPLYANDHGPHDDNPDD